MFWPWSKINAGYNNPRGESQTEEPIVRDSPARYASFGPTALPARGSGHRLLDVGKVG